MQHLRRRESADERVDNWAGNRSHLELVQEMCRHLLNLSEDEVPGSITKCKELLRPIFINLYDYVEGRYHLQFQSARDLFKRCKKLRRKEGYGFYSKGKAKTEGLKDLLRHLFRRS